VKLNGIKILSTKFYTRPIFFNTDQELQGIKLPDMKIYTTIGHVLGHSYLCLTFVLFNAYDSPLVVQVPGSVLKVGTILLGWGCTAPTNRTVP
jgi:hypothetical protein